MGVLMAAAVVMAGAVTTPTASQEADAEVVEVRGSAFGFFADLQLDFDTGPNAAAGGQSLLGASGTGTEGGSPQQFSFGPEPEVVLPPEGGGPFTDSLTNEVIDVPDPAPDGLIDSSEVSTEGALGADGFVRSSSVTTGFNVGGVVATSLASECESTPAGTSGSAEILGIVFSEEGAQDFPDPAPNTVLTDDDIPSLGSDITITLNAQETVDIDGVPTLVVTAVRVDAAPGGDSPSDGVLEIGQSACGVLAATATPATPVPVAPAFTG